VLSDHDRAREKQPRVRKAPSNNINAGISTMSIARFCVRNDISEPMYFKLQANGLGPKTTQLGARTLITIESEKRWRLARERKAVSVEALDKKRRERKRVRTAIAPS
jgi:hypothetical protein